MSLDFVVFQMLGPYRDRLIYENSFYLEQAQKRLFSQFKNKENEADTAAEQYLEDTAHLFNPDVHDGSEFYEAATDHSHDIYQLLAEMEKSVKLSITASMFHHWDKVLRDWLQLEISKWHRTTNKIGARGFVEKQIWTQNFDGIIDLLEVFMPDIKSSDYYRKLDQCRLIVNVYKHGHGNAFDRLKSEHPEYLKDWFESELDDGLFDYKDYTSLNIPYSHIKGFSEAIEQFWKAVPDKVMASEIEECPRWFENAFQKDLGINKGAK